MVIASCCQFRCYNVDQRGLSFQNIWLRRFMRSKSHSNVGCKKSCQSSKYGSDLGQITEILFPQYAKRGVTVVKECVANLRHVSLMVARRAKWLEEDRLGFTPRRGMGFRMELVQGATPICEGSCHLTPLRGTSCWNDCKSCKVRVGSNGNSLWEASVLLGRKKVKNIFRMRNGDVEVCGYAFWANQYTSGFHGVNEQGREGVREFFQQHGSEAKRKLSRGGRNQMGNEPVIALPEGADDFIVYYDARSKDLEVYLVEERGRLLSRWMKLFNEYGFEAKYHLGKANVVVESWSRKKSEAKNKFWIDVAWLGPTSVKRDGEWFILVRQGSDLQLERLLMPRVVKSRDEIFSRWGYCDNRGLSRSKPFSKQIRIGTVLKFDFLRSTCACKWLLGIMRYKVIMRIIDQSGSAFIMIFNTMINKLSGYTAWELMEKHGMDVDEYWTGELLDLVKKRCDAVNDEPTFVKHFKEGFLDEEDNDEGFTTPAGRIKVTNLGDDSVNRVLDMQTPTSGNEASGSCESSGSKRVFIDLDDIDSDED
ncbi:hypothetical protein Tco_0728464 [Tanacetum coccineum]|uniref:Reverse transcriptase domain-containing protein n=1 Tax=Tanacetum coccineum TaxID=301880 RepID=A0ABQ4YL76_9ASTR